MRFMFSSIFRLFPSGGEIFSVIFTIDDYPPDGYNRYINGFYGVIVISALNVEKRWLVQTV